MVKQTAIIMVKRINIFLALLAVSKVASAFACGNFLEKWNNAAANKNEIPTEIFGATCLVKNSVDDSLNLDSSTPFPALDIPYIAEVFDGNSTCAGSPTRMYVLPTGLDEDGFPYTVNSVNVPLDDLIFTVNVTSTDTMTLPLPIGFSYNLNVDWGDGNTSTVTAYNSPGISNMYTSSGEFVVRVSGLAEAFTCNSSASWGKSIASASLISDISSSKPFISEISTSGKR